MTTWQFLAILAAVLTNTVGIVWWAATVNATVKQHGEQLEDHEERLREGKL